MKNTATWSWKDGCSYYCILITYNDAWYFQRMREHFVRGKAKNRTSMMLRKGIWFISKRNVKKDLQTCSFFLLSGWSSSVNLWPYCSYYSTWFTTHMIQLPSFWIDFFFHWSCFLLKEKISRFFGEIRYHDDSKFLSFLACVCQSHPQRKSIKMTNRFRLVTVLFFSLLWLF